MKRKPIIFNLAACLGLALGVGAVQTRQDVQLGFDTFVKGDFEGLSLDSRGVLSPAPEAQLVAEVEGPVIWNAIPDPEGGFFLGTGNSGIILQVGPGGEVSEVFDPEEILSRALAVGPEGNLYVGTSPNGRVYRLRPDGSGGWENPEIYFDPPETYIWDLIFNEAGDLFVATGQSARIYRLPSGFRFGEDEPDLYFRSTETHFSTLELDAAGHLLAGSGPNGIIFRITGPEEGFALYQAEVPEIRSLLPMPDGTLYVATFDAAGGSRRSRAPEPSKAEEKSEEENSNGGGSDKAEPWVVSAFSSAGSEILRIDPDGFVEVFWELPNIQIYDMVSDGEGGLMIGTGQFGRVFRARSRTDWRLVEELPTGGDVSAMLSDGNAIYAFSSNPARVYRMDPGSAGGGSFTSTVLDANQVVSWGRLDAREAGGGSLSGNLSVETRSGNTARPDSTWSAFAALQSGGKITSPTARYLQYRVQWPEKAGEDQTLRAVRAFYRMQNRAPYIRRINVVPMGLKLVTGNNPRRNYDLKNLTESPDLRKFVRTPDARQQLVTEREEGALTAGWDAIDPNGDRLRFRVELKGPDGTGWITLSDDQEDPIYLLNLSGLGEGYYELRVTATDAPDNRPERARSFSRVSNPFLVDLTPPEITMETLKAPPGSARLRFEVSDRAGVIALAGYRLNGGDLVRVLPDDELHDDSRESFTLELDGLAAVSHSLVFEATDENNNVANRQVIFEVD